MLEREGLKEAYFDYDLIPIPVSDGTIGGIFTIAFETTESVLATRRTKVLDALTTQMTARDKKEACVFSIESMQDFPEDIPLAFIYLMDENKRMLKLEASFNVFSHKIPQSHPQIPRYLDLDRPISAPGMAQIIMQVVQNKEPQILDHLQVILGMALRGIWPAIIEKAVVLSISKDLNNTEVLGVLILGVSPRAELSEAYLEIFKRIALKVARNISNAQDKQRAKDLIQIFQTGLESSKPVYQTIL